MIIDNDNILILIIANYIIHPSRGFLFPKAKPYNNGNS